MEIEIRDEIGEKSGNDTLSFYEGTISDSTKKRVFYLAGDRWKIVLQFMEEKELDDLINALQYFKEHKEI